MNIPQGIRALSSKIFDLWGGSDTCTLKIQPLRLEDTGNWTITTVLAENSTNITTSFKVCKEEVP